MVALLVSKTIRINSHKGCYEVNFVQGGMDQLNIKSIKNAIYVIDQNIAQIFTVIK